MSSFVLDTNAISAFAPSRSQKPPLAHQLQDWVRQNADSFFVSAVSIMEIETGILRLGRTSPGAFHNRLQSWFSVILESFSDRIHPVDLKAARIASNLADRAAALGIDPGVADILIAATAVSHGSTLLTRNLRHFAPLGISVIDPFSDSGGLPS